MAVIGEKINLFLERETSVWGPIFLLCTLTLAAKTGIPFDLLSLGVVGFYLSARWQLRGCCYALVLLALFALVKHGWFTTEHLWQLGLEGSLACSYFLTALAFEQGSLSLQALNQQIETKRATIENLEEELAKVREAALAQQMMAQEKIGTLQKESEELQSEHASILILNEVLRKTTARHIQENEKLSASVLDHERQLSLLKEELDETEKELSRLSSTEALAVQNKELIKELNAARFQREQTHLINETLARLYARENLKAKEADAEAAAIGEQLAAAHREVERIAQPLREELHLAHNQIATLKFEFEKAVEGANQGYRALEKLRQVQMERNFLQERLQAALDEIALLSKQKPQAVSVAPQVEELSAAWHKEKIVLEERLQIALRQIEEQQKTGIHLEEQLVFAREKMTHLSQIEPLFKQLKKQFEEKNEVLHQTRSHLFLTDTELQRLKMEKAALELNPLPKEVEEELHELSEQIHYLEEEVVQLEELITLLSGQRELVGEKKK